MATSGCIFQVHLKPSVIDFVYYVLYVALFLLFGNNCCFRNFFFAIIIIKTRVGNFQKFKLRRAASNVDGFRKDKIGSRSFVFLTQTEQCLRQKLVETLRLHSAAKCKCDVIVLSYKKECKQENLASHITIIQLLGEQGETSFTSRR